MQVGLHEALKPVSWLAGGWSTKEGRGKYPTIQDFGYHETLEFVCVGQPMFNIISSSMHPEKQTPMHQDRGFMRIQPGTNNISYIISHNFGLTVIEEGTVDPVRKEINLQSTAISRISFAKPPAVKKTMRTIRLMSTDAIEVVFSMETDKTPMTEHLRAVYNKV